MDCTSDNVARSAIRVFLLVENRLLRDALASLFRKRADLVVVGQTGQPDVTTSQVRESECDVLVIASFGSNGLPANFAQDNSEALNFKTVLIGMDDDEQQFMAAVRAGVTGYLLKDASAADVAAAVRAVYRGEAVCPPQCCSALFRFVAQSTREAHLAAAASRPDLTLRQQQLVALVAKGMTNKEIASRLNLSEFTVRNHIHKILKQVDAGSRSEAVETIRAYGYSVGALD